VSVSTARHLSPSWRALLRDSPILECTSSSAGARQPLISSSPTSNANISFKTSANMALSVGSTSSASSNRHRKYSRTISGSSSGRPDNPQRVHAPNEATDFPLHFHIAFAGAAFGSSQKPAPPDHKNPTAPRTLALYRAGERFCFTETVDVGSSRCCCCCAHGSAFTPAHRTTRLGRKKALKAPPERARGFCSFATRVSSLYSKASVYASS